MMAKPAGGQVHVLNHTDANSVDQRGSQLFYALTAAENLLCFGLDVSNAFGEAPPPIQGFYICLDKAFHAWWISKVQPPIPEGYVIPVLAAMSEGAKLHLDMCNTMYFIVSRVTKNV